MGFLIDQSRVNKFWEAVRTNLITLQGVADDSYQCSDGPDNRSIANRKSSLKCASTLPLT